MSRDSSHDGVLRYVTIEVAAEILLGEGPSTEDDLAWAWHYLWMTSGTGGVKISDGAGGLTDGPPLHRKSVTGSSEMVRRQDIVPLRPHYAEWRGNAAKLDDTGKRRPGRRRGVHFYAEDPDLIAEGVRLVAAGTMTRHRAADVLALRAKGPTDDARKKRLYRGICRECKKLDIK